MSKRAQDRWCVDEQVVAPRREVHRAAVERADLRLELGDVLEPLGRSRHVGARVVERERRLVAPEDEVAAHAGGEVHDDVDVRRAKAIHDVAVQPRIAGALACVRIADVDVHDRSPRARRFEGRLRDLLRGHRDAVAALDGLPHPRHGARDEDLPVHR